MHQEPSGEEHVSRRRGRPQHLPEEQPPPRGNDVAAHKRVAWLLATSRILGPHHELARQEAFAQALRAHDFQVDNSRISKWESGNRPVGLDVVAAYEALLTLPAGSLVAVAIGTHRAAGTPPGRRTAAGALDARDLETAFAQAEAGEATGATWLRLAHSLATEDDVYVAPAMWHDLATVLLNELGRAIGAGYVRREEACHLLLRLPSARRHLVRAIGEVVTDPHAQVVQPALALLAGLDDPSASALLMRLLESDSHQVRHAATGVVPATVVRGTIPDEHLPRLVTVSASALRGVTTSTGGLHALDLAAALPDQSYEEVRRQVPDALQRERLQHAREHGLLVSPELAHSVGRSLAHIAQEETGTPGAAEPDTLLERLVVETLFHVHRERRHRAGVLLAASPYAPAFVHGCLTLAEDSPEIVTCRVLTALSLLGLGRRRTVVMHHVTDPATTVAVRIRALHALALSPEAMDDQEADTVTGWAIAAEAPQVRRAALFALGMNAPARIAALTRGDDPWLCAAAHWWSMHGAALKDEDDSHIRRPVADPAWLDQDDTWLG